MRYIFITTGLIPLIVQSLLAGELTTHNVNGRRYELFVPSNLQGSSIPLVLNLHGFESDSATQRTHTRMNEVAEKDGFVVVYPDGNGNWFFDDNVAFLTSVIDSVDSQLDIDRNRIYAAGFSLGGHFAHVFAAESGQVAAVASVSGVPWLTDRGDLFPNGSVPAGPTPALHIHGTADPLVPFDGGTTPLATFPPAESFVDAMVETNGCKSRTETLIPDVVETDESTVLRTAFGDCSPYINTDYQFRQYAVEFYEIDNGAHAWPGDQLVPPTLAGFNPVNQDILASEVIWEFFEQHTLPHTLVDGDFNSNGQLDASDIDHLSRAVQRGEYRLWLDLNGDLEVDNLDRMVWVEELAQTRFGDANLDGGVTFEDFLVLSENFGQPGSWAEGDFTGDNHTAFADFLILAENFGGSVDAAAIPEPRANLLSFTAIALLSHTLRRRRSKRGNWRLR